MKAWFMYDCHVFAKVPDLSRDALKKRTQELFREDGCGSMFVHDESGASIGALTLHGSRQPDGKYGVAADDLDAWLDQVETERSFRTLMA